MTAVLVEAPVPVSLVKRPPLIRSAVDGAWDAYYAHSSSCAHCARLLHNCRDGAALWASYREARGPITTPIPGGR